MSHAAHLRRARGDEIPMFNLNALDRIFASTLPTPLERADNFNLYLGRIAGASIGTKFDLEHEKVASLIGDLNGSDSIFCADQWFNRGFLSRSGDGRVGLTLDGWSRIDKLTKKSIDSRRAFIAMLFDIDLLDRLYEEFFKPAVQQTGFTLYRIDENSPAGSIDDRLRVEIRRLGFLIAELTDDNSGAYWEVGFSEELERPFIYTFSKPYFKKNGTHFYANHSHTIIWDPDDLKDAAEKLKAKIRATLPSEAILEDL
ncbi:MAG: hypothetical protein VW268_10405 [Rhodospirillaceae bacterium]